MSEVDYKLRDELDYKTTTLYRIVGFDRSSGRFGKHVHFMVAANSLSEAVQKVQSAYPLCALETVAKEGDRVLL